MRVLSVIGTRPEALKMGPVIGALQVAGVESLVCTTGQQRALADSTLRLFGIRAEYRLSLRSRGKSTTESAAKLLAGLGQVIDKCRPDWVLAAGDTTSVATAAMAAAYGDVRFGHVEAGLRSGDKRSPFPEELHRRLAAVAADIHFAPTRNARENLLRENIAARSICVTGNTIVDSLRRFESHAESAGLDRHLSRHRLALSGTNANRRIVVVTIHRRENFGQPVEAICRALRRLAREFQNQLLIVCLVHPNPNVAVPVRRSLAGVPDILLLRPLSYPRMLALLQRASVVLTDSGGLQEEAPYFQVPVLVLRERSERPEGIAAGVARLIGTSEERIVKETRRLLNDESARRAMTLESFQQYGDGHAAKRIVAALLRAEHANGTKSGGSR